MPHLSSHVGLSRSVCFICPSLPLDWKDLTVGLAHTPGGKGKEGMYQLIIGNKGNLQVDLQKRQVKARPFADYFCRLMSWLPPFWLLLFVVVVVIVASGDDDVFLFFGGVSCCRGCRWC